MSAICGVYDRSGAPIDHGVLARMAAAARYRGPDGIGSRVADNTGMVQLLMATTPEAIEENAPFVHLETGSWIVFDGRLDNREELVRILDPEGRNRRDDTDMELVLLAWLKWGEECPSHLLGDFAFAIHDPASHRLFCARDISSIKPFYYADKAEAFVFGSTVAQVLAHPAVSSTVNEAMVAEVLTGLHLSRTETLYRDIQRLPGGYSLLADKAGIRLQRHWHASEIRPVRYSRFEDYAGHFEELFTEAVRCRLRSNGGVAVTLSGGKDSGSIAGMAQSLFREEGSGRNLSSYSLTFPGRSCDESALIADVVAKWGINAHYYPFENFGTLPDWAEQVKLTRDLPEAPTFSALDAAQRHSVAAGTRVWLYGTGSQSVLGGTEFPYRDLLRERHPFQKLFAEFLSQKTQYGFKYAIFHMGVSLLWPSLPAPIRKRIQAHRHRFITYGFADDEFLRRSGLEQRFIAALDAHEFDDLRLWSVCSAIFSGERASNSEAHDLAHGLNGIEIRRPFEDRRLVEFSLAIPCHVKRSHTVPKRLLASLAARLLPSRVIANEGNSEAGCLFLDILSRDFARTLFEPGFTIERSWVSQTKLRAVRDRLSRAYRAEPKSGWETYNREDYRELSNLWSAVALELWLSKVAH